MSWVNILAIISVLIGLVIGARGLKSLRSQEHPQAEIRWKQPPLSPWRYETPTMVVITLHSMGLICLTALVLFGLTRNDVLTYPPKATPSFLLSAIALFAVFFTAYVSGVMVIYHFVQQWISPISYGISLEGMFYGGMRVDWKSYSHYELGPEAGLISLFSSYSPALRTWVVLPPSESYSSVLGLIQNNLPSMPPADDSIPWQRSPLILFLDMAALVIGTLLLTAWGWIRNPSWVWIYALIAFFFVQYLGIKLITLFDGRGQTPSAKPEEGMNE